MVCFDTLLQVLILKVDSKSDLSHALWINEKNLGGAAPISRVFAYEWQAKDLQKGIFALRRMRHPTAQGFEGETRLDLPPRQEKAGQVEVWWRCSAPKGSGPLRLLVDDAVAVQSW